MIDSKVSFLTWLAIANTTLSSRNFLSISNTNAILLPRQMASTFHLDKLKFNKLTNIISYQNLLISRCFTDRSSFFKLRSHGPLSIRASVFYEGKFEAINRNVHVTFSKFYLKSDSFFNVENSKSAYYKFADFTTESSKPALIFNKVNNITIRICNFTKATSGAVKILNSASADIYFGIFNKCESVNGGAIFSDSKSLFIEQSYFVECKAMQSGGSIYLTQSVNSTILSSVFADNRSPVGESIDNNGHLDLLECKFTGDSKSEIKGDFRSSSNSFNQNRNILGFQPSPSDAPTDTFYPIPTIPRMPQNPIIEEVDTMTLMLIVLIAVLCVAVIVGIGFFVYWRMKKQRNTIYASEKEIKDENEMGTVEIKSKYSLTKVYSIDQ